MKKQHMDEVLVPVGLLLLFAYHSFLLHRLFRHPTRTVIGINNINRGIWVQTMMEDSSKNGVLAVQTLRNNIMASTLLASTAIMLSSVIAVLMTNGWGSSPALRPEAGAAHSIVYGDTGDAIVSIKFFSILSCFLAAFLFNVQSIRLYSHASILINVPVRNRSSFKNLVTVDYVTAVLNKGSYFWSLGLRAFYFSLPLFMWIFGPIPMFVCCAAMVVLLYFLDVTFDRNMSGCGDEEEEGWEGSVLTEYVDGTTPEI